ncbi:hypothetical protein LGM46_29270 [Burkholderia arboris]|uniref:hypothetical protein n=1 Tax=Burkholderia arboris TaxID=488730 RepID=UPI001CF26B0F|nr:hypothetical protein [Burkholderia arboris]MCA8037063.1 hypothetical protein [Burkholderia arboris]
MKMARASQADVDAAIDVTRILSELEKGYMPSSDEDEGEETEFFDRDDPEQCQKALCKLLDAADKGSILRVTWGMVVVLDPDNELLDPEADTIEMHPKIVAALKSRAPRTEVAGAVPADDKPCTCHPDDRVEPCARQYAASECKRAQHEPQVADDNTTWPVTSKNIALHALQARMAASQSTSDSHEWDDVGERCIKCGDKDWMADPVCRGATPAAAAGQEAVAWVRKHPDTGKLSGDWLWNDVIEQCRKDSGVWFPLGYLTAPPAQVATRQELTEQAIADAVTKWFPDRAYQAPFFARALFAGEGQ